MVVLHPAVIGGSGVAQAIDHGALIPAESSADAEKRIRKEFRALLLSHDPRMTYDDRVIRRASRALMRRFQFVLQNRLPQAAYEAYDLAEPMISTADAGGIAIFGLSDKWSTVRR